MSRRSCCFVVRKKKKKKEYKDLIETNTKCINIKNNNNYNMKLIIENKRKKEEYDEQKIYGLYIYIYIKSH